MAIFMTLTSIPGKSNVESSRVIEEAYALVFIGSDAGHDDEILFSPLESINGGHLDLRVQLRV